MEQRSLKLEGEVFGSTKALIETNTRRQNRQLNEIEKQCKNRAVNLSNALQKQIDLVNKNRWAV